MQYRMINYVETNVKERRSDFVKLNQKKRQIPISSIHVWWNRLQDTKIPNGQHRLNIIIVATSGTAPTKGLQTWNNLLYIANDTLTKSSLFNPTPDVPLIRYESYWTSFIAHFKSVHRFYNKSRAFQVQETRSSINIQYMIHISMCEMSIDQRQHQMSTKQTMISNIQCLQAVY